MSLYSDLQQAKKHLDWLFNRVKDRGVAGIDIEDWMTAFWAWGQVRGVLDDVRRPEAVEECPGCPHQRSKGQICARCGTWDNDRV